MATAAKRTRERLNSYREIVRANLEHMGTPSSEWAPVPVKGMAETTGPKGTPVTMPEFDFPAGYSKAPTLYPQSGGAENGSCELCAHPIRNFYWLQNDARRWTLAVGSECVTHFGEGKTGERLTREQSWERSRQLARDAEALAYRLQRENYIHGTLTRTGKALSTELEALASRVQPDPLPGRSVELFPPSTGGVLTRWEAKHGERVRALMAQGTALLESPEWRLSYRHKIIAAIQEQSNQLANGYVDGPSWHRVHHDLTGPARVWAENEIKRLEAQLAELDQERSR
jgi:hypothetical protein